MLSRLNSGILNRLQFTLGGDCNPFLGTFFQSVRWKRKPIWAPVAKSKMFRIPVKKKLPDDEDREIRRLYNEYRTYYTAVRRFLFEEHLASMKESSENSMRVDDDINHALKLNEKWNKEVAAMREKRLAQEAKEERDKNLEYMIRAEQEKEEHIKLIDEIVKEEKEKSATFITPENLDEAIEFALANPVDFNFAIDLKGNIIHGKKGKLDDILKKEEQVAVSNS